MLSWPDNDAADEAARLQRIEKGLRRAVALNPRFAPTHALLAQALVDLDRAADALPFAQQSVVLASTDAHSHLALARAYGALSRREEAAASAKRALGFASNDSERRSAQRLLDFYTKP